LHNASSLSGLPSIIDVRLWIAWPRGGCHTLLLAPCVTRLRTQYSMFLHCVSSLGRVWSRILQKWVLITIAPQQTASCFSSWWCSALKGVPQKLQNVLDFLIILEAWEILKHKSDYVFNGARPSVPAVLWTVANDSPSGVRLERWHFRNCYLGCLPWLINFVIGVSWSTRRLHS